MITEPTCCVCSQQEGPFPGVREAERILSAHGWLRTTSVDAWRDGHWASGYPYFWYCTHHADDWRRAVRDRAGRHYWPNTLTESYWARGLINLALKSATSAP